MEKYTKFKPKFNIGDVIKYKGFRYEIVSIVMGVKFYYYNVRCLESKFIVEDYIEEIVTSIGMQGENNMELVESAKKQEEWIPQEGDIFRKKGTEKLNEAKRLYETANSDQRYVLECLFPELSELGESEDERIRKNLITCISTFKHPLFSEIERKEFLAWLEKQGKHAIACSEEQMKVLNEVLNFAANHESPYWNDYIFETLNNLIRQLKN